MTSQDAGRGSALTAKGRATRARILDVAADLMHEQGVSDTGIDDVRKAARVSGSQMTHYFRDKQTLVHDVIARRAEATITDHRAPELDGFSTLASLRRWADLVLARQYQRGFRGGCTFGSLAGQLAESDPASRDNLADGFKQWLGLFRDGLAAMKSTGELAKDADPQALAYALLTSMQGGMLLTQTFREIAPLEAAFNSALSCVASFATDPSGATQILGLPKRTLSRRP